MAKLYPPSTCTTKIGSELASNPRRIVVRSSQERLQNWVGVHLRLKSVQDCRLMSSAVVAELVKLIRAFLRGMVVLCGFIRIVVVDQTYGSETWGCIQLNEEMLWASVS